MSSSVIFKPEETDFKVDTYLRDLLAQCESQPLGVKTDIADELQALRQKATSQVSQSKLPSQKEEEWRFTDLSDLLRLKFQLAAKATVNPNALDGLILLEANHSRLVFVNGIYAPELSDVSVLTEVYVGNLGGLSVSQNEQIVKYLAQQEGANEVFTALNTAGLADVAIIWASPNAIVETPIYLLFLSIPSESPTFSQPRVLVVAETGASVQFVEYYGANIPQNHPYFTNAVTEIWVEENAQVNHSRIQQEAGAGFHIARSAIAQSQNSRYTCNEINLGGKLSRHNLEIFQKGKQTETQLNGLTMIGGEQIADTHSLISLTQPHGITNQLHKCIVDDSAHAVFNGKVFVPKAAQLTNAAQLNRNLLLSPKARINTKPELQITADNVKCSHGATVSQLEADEVFYLRSRGLTEADARHLLIDAFAAEIIDRIPLESLRQKLTQCVACRTTE